MGWGLLLLVSWSFQQKEAELILLRQEVTLGAGGPECPSTVTGYTLHAVTSCIHTYSPALRRDVPSELETTISTQGHSPALRAKSVPAATTVSKPLTSIL